MTLRGVCLAENMIQRMIDFLTDVPHNDNGRAINLEVDKLGQSLNNNLECITDREAN